MDTAQRQRQKNTDPKVVRDLVHTGISAVFISRGEAIDADVLGRIKAINGMVAIKFMTPAEGMARITVTLNSAEEAVRILDEYHSTQDDVAIAA